MQLFKVVFQAIEDSYATFWVALGNLRVVWILLEVIVLEGFGDS